MSDSPSTARYSVFVGHFSAIQSRSTDHKRSPQHKRNVYTDFRSFRRDGGIDQNVRDQNSGSKNHADQQSKRRRKIQPGFSAGLFIRGKRLLPITILVKH